MVMLFMALAFAAPDPSTLNAPRKAYVACLRTFENQSVQGKIDKAGYAEAIKTACPAESAALVAALVRYDVAMGTKRAAAEANAQRDVEDYWAESQERFADRIAN